MVVNLNAKEFRKERKVKQPLHTLSRRKKAELFKSPLADVLDIEFLRYVGLQRSETSLRAARDSIALTFAALNANTLKDVQQFSLSDLTLIPGMGNKSLALLLDLLQAFDIELAPKPLYKKLNPAKGGALAQRLGLRS